MPDEISFYRVARLSLFPPREPGGHYRYALVATRVKRGIPSATVLLDGIVPGGHPTPTTEELLEAFDSAVRKHMLAR